MVTRRLHIRNRRSRAAPGHRRRPTPNRHTPNRRDARAAVRMLALVAAMSSATVVVSVRAATDAGAQPGVWVEPVVAPVVDGYRPPPHLGAPGNRGWEYLTDPGTVVVAAGDGVVVFAGPIGGSDYVSIQHPDGRRTTYSHVATIAVEVGDSVVTGAPIGTSGERLHFGVRVGDEYRDPGELFAASSPGTPGGEARFDDGLRLIPAAERAATARSASVPPYLAIAPTAALGRWLASVDLVRVDGAGSAWGWSGAATATLAGGRPHSAVGP